MDRLCRLSDAEWARLQPLLPPATRTGGRNAKPHRPIIEAMIWVLRTGAPWRDLPAAYGPWQSVYTRWSRWSSSGVMASLLEALARDRDSESFLIDATVVRAHQDASGARKKGGPRDWAFSRRSVHEAACRGRCARQPRSPRVDPMPNPRDEACIRAARRHRERQCDRRSSLRREAPRRAAGGARLHRNYPVEPNAGGATRESWRSQERAYGGICGELGSPGNGSPWSFRT